MNQLAFLLDTFSYLQFSYFVFTKHNLNNHFIILNMDSKTTIHGIHKSFNIVEIKCYNNLEPGLKLDGSHLNLFLIKMIYYFHDCVP